MHSFRSRDQRCPHLAIGSGTSRFIVQASEVALPNETGGILVGIIGEDAIHVATAVGPGPRALQAPASFRRDGEYSQRELDWLYVESEGEYDYVGEWHSHPVPVGPSSRDRRSMAWIAAHPGYDRSYPVLILSQRARDGTWSLHAYRWEGKRLRRLVLEVSGT